MNFVLKKLLILPVFIMLIGCSMIQVKPETVQLLPQNKEFVFIEESPSGRKITENEIIEKIAEQIRKNSGIRPLGKIHSGSGQLYYLKGLDIKVNGNAIAMSYVNGDYHESVNIKYSTDIFAKYEVDINTNNGKKYVNVRTPSIVDLKPGKGVLFIPIRPLISMPEAIADINNINKMIDPEITDFRRCVGEIDVKYNDESVYANFSRLLGLYNYKNDEIKKYDIKKDRVFNLGLTTEPLPVKIVVYPYRNGSKVVYEFESKFSIKSNGTTTFDESKINNYVATIRKVANN